MSSAAPLKTYYISSLQQTLSLEVLIRPHALQLRDWFYQWTKDRDDVVRWVLIGRDVDNGLDQLWANTVYASDEGKAAHEIRQRTTKRLQDTEMVLRSLSNADFHCTQFQNNTGVLFENSMRWELSVGAVRAAYWEYACVTWLAALQGINSGLPASSIAPSFTFNTHETKSKMRRQHVKADPLGHDAPDLRIVQSEPTPPPLPTSMSSVVARAAAAKANTQPSWLVLQWRLNQAWGTVRLWLHVVDLPGRIKSFGFSLKRHASALFASAKRPAPKPGAEPQQQTATEHPKAPIVPITETNTEAQHPEGVAQPINGKALQTSAFGTWLGLVVLSWISLLWGAIITIPFGIGLGIIATFFVGVIAIPLWGTMFGLLNMSGARDSTLRSMDFKPLTDNHPMHDINAVYSDALDIPPPKIGTIDVYNAFAMGTRQTNATVALGQPLMDTLTDAEVRAILGHELGHVVSGDMRRMMLMRTFQNACVWYMMVQELQQFARWALCWVAELQILSFSRRREFWADAIGASLAGKEAMIGALQKLEAGPNLCTSETINARFMFRGRPGAVFSTHPTTADRIAALEAETYIRQLPKPKLIS